MSSRFAISGESMPEAEVGEKDKARARKRFKCAGVTAQGASLGQALRSPRPARALVPFGWCRASASALLPNVGPHCNEGLFNVNPFPLVAMADGKTDYYGVSSLSELPMAQAGSQTPSEDDSGPELDSKKRKRPMNVTYATMAPSSHPQSLCSMITS